MIRWNGMAVRIALLGWVVTTLTIGVFLAVSLPQRNHEFQMNMQSKAKGVAASIRATVAGAAISEDYSSVVDHTIQVLQGDNAIDYLVISKNDGFSIIAQQDSWTTETLDGDWIPSDRVDTGTITQTDLIGRRAFHFSTPFDYSGLEWGWIHIGLSLDSYNESVQRNLTTTLLIAVLCILLSLVLSTGYAQRLVRPIRDLNVAMQRVSAGKLETRAAVHHHDEVGDLAISFNGMTAAILARNRALEAIGAAAQDLVFANHWRNVIDEVLRSIGNTLGACRVCVLRWDSQPSRPSFLYSANGRRIAWMWHGSHGKRSIGAAAPRLKGLTFCSNRKSLLCPCGSSSMTQLLAERLAAA
jgi:two-component system, NtrC family, sensor kinase